MKRRRIGFSGPSSPDCQEPPLQSLSSAPHLARVYLQLKDNGPSYAPILPPWGPLAAHVPLPQSPALVASNLKLPPQWPGRHLSAGVAVAMLLTERAEGRHQHQQGPAGPTVHAVSPTLAQVAGGAGQAPAAALVCQAAQAGGVGGAGRGAVGFQEEEGDLLGEEA